MALPGLKALEREAAGPKTRRFNARVGRYAGRGLVCSAENDAASRTGYHPKRSGLRGDCMRAAHVTGCNAVGIDVSNVAPIRKATSTANAETQRKAREVAENAKDGLGSC